MLSRFKKEVKEEVKSDPNFEATACIIKFGMDWKQRINIDCLTSITLTAKVGSEVRQMLIKAGPVAERELLLLAERHVKEKDFYTAKARLVKEFIVEQQRLESDYARSRRGAADPVSA